MKAWELKLMILRITVLLGCFACVLAACGDDDDAGALDAGRDAASGSGMDASSSHDAATEADTGTAHHDAAEPADDAGPGMRTVTIRFVGRVGNAHLECGASYANQGSTEATITPIDFRFYVQDLKLVTANGDEVDVKIDARDPWQADGVAMIDLEDATGSCDGTPETNDRITGHVPQGTYTGVRFANGVPEALNHADQTTLPPVLQFAGMQWSWLTGFRFMKAEVQQVLEGDEDAGTIPGNGAVHPGATGCSGNPGAGDVKCSKLNRNAVRLDHFDPDHDRVAADLGAIFDTSDLTQVVQCHGAGEDCGPLLERLGIDVDTGKPISGQKVFRVD